MKKQQPLKPQYVLVPFRSSAGIGLKTLHPIPARTKIIEYTGDLLSMDRANAIGGKYLFEINSKWVIYGPPKINKAGYINHSCHPNCETKASKKKVFIYSKRCIKAGEEITYNYGEEYFDDFIKKIGCRCVKCNHKKR